METEVLYPTFPETLYNPNIDPDMIRRISIQESVLSLDGNPFGYFSSLEEIIVHPNHPSLAVENSLLIDRNAKRVLVCPPGIPIGNIVVPQWIASIAPFAFLNCSRIRSISLPDSITAIGEAAFSGCSCLEEVNLPAGLNEIAPLTFSNCDSLKQITLPEGILRVGDFAFSSCRSLTALHLPNSIESLGYCAFTCCTGL